jgi:hypothetical protein
VVVVCLYAGFLEYVVVAVREVGAGFGVRFALGEGEGVRVPGGYCGVDVVEFGGIDEAVRVEGVHGKRGCSGGDFYERGEEDEYGKK